MPRSCMAMHHCAQLSAMRAGARSCTHLLIVVIVLCEGLLIQLILLIVILILQRYYAVRSCLS